MPRQVHSWLNSDISNGQDNLSEESDASTSAPAWIRLGFVPGRKLETWAAISLTAIIVCFHAARLARAAGLWRDEAAAVQLAAMPAFSDVVSHWPHEAFPLLFQTILRGYGWITGSTDTAWRIFGLLVGVSIIATLWWNMRVVRRGVPLLSLALLGFNADFVQWGDSIRGYGLGSLFMLLTMGLIWRVVERPTKWRIAAAALGAIASVQCLLQNSILLLAICLGGAAVALARGQGNVAADVSRRKHPRPRRSASIYPREQLSAIVLGVGLLAALSLLPYWGTIQKAREWDMVIRSPTSIEHLSLKLGEALSSSGWWNTWIWAVLLVAGLGLCLRGQFLPRSQNRSGFSGGSEDEWPGQQATLLFSGTVLIIGVAGCLTFLLVLSYLTQPWYYLGLLALVALLLDVVFDSFRARVWARNGRLVIALVIAATSLAPTWRQAQQRQTNVDLLASKLAQVARKGDLIVVVPWYNGISFDRYYHGPAEWMTVPPLAFHKFHRYDLFKAQMALPDPNAAIEPVQDRIRDTLKSGHRVWLVGGSRLLKPGEMLQSLAPAPDPTWGWQNEIYSGVWAAKVAAYLQFSSLHTEEISLPFTGPVNKFENMPLRMFDGWAAP